MGLGEDAPVRHVFRYLVDGDPAEGDLISLCDDDSHHLSRVVRRQVGDPVEVIAPAGDLWPCEVVTVGRPATVRVGGPALPAPAACDVTLWVGLTERGRLDLGAGRAAELGVRRRGVVVTARAKRVPDADAWDRRAARMQRLAVSAARQSGRGVRPIQMGLVPWAHVIETTPSGQGIILDPRAGTSLDDALGTRAGGDAVTLLVGPDTGFSDGEADEAVAGGFTAVQMGAGVLRAETAAITAAALTLGALGGLG